MCAIIVPPPRSRPLKEARSVSRALVGNMRLYQTALKLKFHAIPGSRKANKLLSIG